MKHLKKKSDLEIFVNKSLKSGKKYKYYIYFKNLIKFYLKYMKIFGILNRKKIDKLKDEKINKSDNEDGFKKKVAPLIREDNKDMMKYMKRNLFNDIARINTMHREFSEEINKKAIENNKRKEEFKKITEERDKERRNFGRFDASWNRKSDKKSDKTEEIEEDIDLVLIKQLINKSSIKNNFHNFLYNIKVIKKKKKKI